MAPQRISRGNFLRWLMGKVVVKKDPGHLREPFSRTKLGPHDQVLREPVYLGRALLRLEY